MRCGLAGRELIKRYESCRLTAYRDPAGVWTIGYGHTGDVKSGQRITQHQADVLFDYDLERVEDAISELLKGCAVTENQFDACCSLAFNVGVSNFAHSTLRKRLQRGDTKGAAEEFERWRLAGGQVLPGLVKRRRAERELFESPMREVAQA